MIETRMREAQSLLLASKHTVALTGAGMSTPSGIPDFRSPNSGLWQDHDPYQVASIYSFCRHPEAFYEWIYPLAKKTASALPNPAHDALAQLEKYGPLRAIITQNIDMLHSRAGAENVLEIHGHLRSMTCVRCYSVYEADNYIPKFLKTGEIPHCPCTGVLKPNVILFGEQLPVTTMSVAKQQARGCDLLLVAGSSLEVAPAGELPALAKSQGARLIIVNLTETHADRFADLIIRGDVVDVLPRLVQPFLPAEF